jgi:tRNA(Ile)-lysidine synthase
VPLSTTARGFVRAMARLGPFEPTPHIAVAVSGGADSMALALLADRWARGQGGRVTAVTVDHGLRDDSYKEALGVRRTLRAQGIDHVILRWCGVKPATGIQAAARAARYALLEGWCRDNAVLHLLVAHHRGDQAETVVMRRAMKSGPDGLAGMAAIVYRRDVRLLRPLLDAAPEDLRRYLRRAGVAWVEDPSNTDDRYTRVRTRRAMTPAARDRLVTAANRAAMERARRDSACATLLARTVYIKDGQGRMDRAAFTAPAALSQRALARMIACIGGRDYAPKRAPLARAHAALKAGRSVTLGGCRLTAGSGGVTVQREGQRAGGAGAANPAIRDCEASMTGRNHSSGPNPLKTASFPAARITSAPLQALFAAPFPVV